MTIKADIARERFKKDGRQELIKEKPINGNKSIVGFMLLVKLYLTYHYDKAISIFKDTVGKVR